MLEEKMLQGAQYSETKTQKILNYCELNILASFLVIFNHGEAFPSL